jgi:hypothetical protein
MTDDEYELMQQQVLFLGSILVQMDLDGFLARIEHAHAVGPILDPTLYRAAMAKMGQIETVAVALRGAQRKIQALKERLEHGKSD